MICAKFDGNLLRIFNVIVKKTFCLLFVDTVYLAASPGSVPWNACSARLYQYRPNVAI